MRIYRLGHIRITAKMPDTPTNDFDKARRFGVSIEGFAA